MRGEATGERVREGDARDVALAGLDVDVHGAAAARAFVTLAIRCRPIR